MGEEEKLVWVVLSGRRARTWTRDEARLPLCCRSGCWQSRPGYRPVRRRQEDDVKFEAKFSNVLRRKREKLNNFNYAVCHDDGRTIS